MGDRIAVAFERAPVLVERLAALRDAPPDRIIAEARRVIGRLDEAAQIEILNAHPRIGADAATLSERSRAEQGAAADARTLRELALLNEAY
ncbi:MAG TPA: 2-oxo-4-hydroxy-4-carboxy-5-ureidoimidazoline decarboxylase, partial [Candidatus Limnocylindria bacterium]|nr:2-oxo-4-hydroxy-4-carboxy-5-ureidoimidazoline decarboxylase [Candidatus Limnocylindria bacterium]